MRQAIARSDWTQGPIVFSTARLLPSSQLPEPYPESVKASHSPSHVSVCGPVAAFRRRPNDILRRVFDIAGFTVHAVRRVNHEPRIIVAVCHDFEHSRGAIALCGLRIDRQILSDG